MSSDEFERILRAALADRAEQAPDPDELTRRVLSNIDLSDQAGRVGDPVRSARFVTPSADRFRRRRVARLLVPLASAASVAAVVALGLVITHDSGRNSSTSSASLPEGGADLGSGRGAASLPRSASSPAGPVYTAGASGGTGGAGATSSATTPSVPSTAQSGTASPMPTGFQVTDLSFDSPTTGFAVGTLACAAGRCAALARSTDPRKWTLVSTNLPFTVPTATASQPTVNDIRFATASIGYAYGPDALFVTSDGGVSWTDTRSSASALEVADGTVVRVTATGCPSLCAYSLSIAKAGTSQFNQVELPGASPQGTGVALARAGKNAYVALTTASGEGEAFLSSADDGQSWTEHSADLCGGESGNTVTAQVTSLAAASDGSVTALCSADTAQYTVTSVDGGTSFSVGRPLTSGRATTVASASAKTLLIGGSSVSRSTDGGQTWAVVTALPQLGATRFLGFQNDQLGRWVGGTGGSVWMTTDGGATYSEYAFS